MLDSLFANFSGRFFADFQIPPHDGHLTLSTTVSDFHRQASAHAGRTSKKAYWFFIPKALL
jgi:hypothetical protein